MGLEARSLSQADEGGFVPGAEESKTAMRANLRALLALCPLAPLAIGVWLQLNDDLAGEMRDDAAGDVFAAIRKASIE